MRCHHTGDMKRSSEFLQRFYLIMTDTMRVTQCRFPHIGDSARGEHWKIAESNI